MVHPLHILAIHLALVTRPGARWIALSYSANRFPFLPSYKSGISAEEYDSSLPADVIARGLPDPSKLWTLVEREPVPSAYGPKEGDLRDGVAQAAWKHWIYVLERTGEELKVQGM